MGTPHNIDYADYAARLRIEAIHSQDRAINHTPYLTNPMLYISYQPFNPALIVLHAPVSENVLPYFADECDRNWTVVHRAGSIVEKRFVCAHQVIPTDEFTVYDLVPSGYGCGHTNPGRWREYDALNYRAFGIEIDNMQHPTDHFTDAQYIKTALTCAYKAALHHIPDIHIISHSQAVWAAVLYTARVQGNQYGTYGMARGAHTDPESGYWEWGQFWYHLGRIREHPEIFEAWKVPYYDGR